MKYRLLYFIGGVVVGSAATFLFLKQKMQEEIDDEVQAFKEEYAEKRKPIPLAKIVEKEESDMGVKFTAVPLNPSEIARMNEQKKKDILENKWIVEKQNYNLFSKPPKAKDIHNGIDEGMDLAVEYEEIVDSTPPRDDLAEKPYVISPDQFVNEQPFYDKVTLEYYEDDILSEAISESIIEDVEAAIGYDSLTKFGEYEEDVVYVRNERTSTDYEVIMQHRPFSRIPDEDS